MAGSNAHEQSRQHGKFAGQNVCNHAPLGVDENGIEAALIAAYVAPGPLQRSKAAIVKQKPRDEIESFVSRGSGNSGKARQPLPIGENLLGHHIERCLIFRPVPLDQPL